MERPLELLILERQRLWNWVLASILQYAVDRAALAPGGPIAGTATANEWGEVSVDTGELDRHIDVDFPPLSTGDPEAAIRAIISAGTLDGKTPAGLDLKTITRLCLVALGEDDVDSMVEELFPDGWEEDRLARAAALARATAGEGPDPETREAALALVEAIREAAKDA